jgi:hypothetical protein
MPKVDITKTFKIDEDFDSWLKEQREHPHIQELGLSELIRLCLKIGMPMLQAPPCFAKTLSEFHERSQ